MANKRFGWHSGALTCRDITVNNDMTIEGDMSFGDASTDTLTVNGIISFATDITGRAMYMSGHVVSDTAGANATLYFAEAVSRTGGEQITLYAKQNWSGDDTTDIVASRPLDAKAYIDSGTTWTDASCVTAVFALTEMDGTMNGSSIYIHALHGELTTGSSGVYTLIDYEACLGLKNASSKTISTGNRYFQQMFNSVASTINSVMHIKQAAEGATYIITNLFSFENCAHSSSFVTTAYTGNGAWVPNNKGTFTQCGQLQILIGSETYYIPYGTVA